MTHTKHAEICHIAYRHHGCIQPLMQLGAHGPNMLFCWQPSGDLSAYKTARCPSPSDKPCGETVLASLSWLWAMNSEKQRKDEHKNLSRSPVSQGSVFFFLMDPSASKWASLCPHLTGAGVCCLWEWDMRISGGRSRQLFLGKLGLKQSPSAEAAGLWSLSLSEWCSAPSQMLRN